MRRFLACLLLASSLAPLPAAAQAQSCGDLWYRRNAVYKAAGYCFKTARAIQAFGNAGCMYDGMDEVPLSPVQHRIVADIIAQERAWGCRD